MGMEWGFDHLVVRCRDVETSLAFYTTVLGLPVERLEEWRSGVVAFPSLRLNSGVVIDLFPSVYDPKDAKGSSKIDHVCFTLDSTGFETLQIKLANAGVAIDEGPKMRWGAKGEGLSIYFHDPDGLKIEVRTYDY